MELLEWGDLPAVMLILALWGVVCWIATQLKKGEM